MGTDRALLRGVPSLPNLLGGFAWQAPEHSLIAALVSADEVIIDDTLEDFFDRLRDCIQQFE
jgi:hypothetical protein